MKIAWLGLGRIGLPMAARLAAAGWSVSGFDPDRARLDLAAPRGIVPAADFSAAGLIFTSLPTEDALLAVARDLAARASDEAIVVDTSTVGPKASAAAAETLATRGLKFLRAPISGSTATAEAGALTTFVSGSPAAFEAARGAMQAYSRAQLWVGEGEEARYAKLAVNLMVAVTAGMMGEALALGRKGGIGWPALLDLIGESVVCSPLVKYKLDPLRRRDFTAAATNSLVQKDLELIVRTAEECGIPVPLARHMQSLYRALVAAGLEDEDFFGAVKETERLAGLGEPEQAP